MNELSASFSQEFAQEALVKMLPPKLLYRFRAWMRKMRPKNHLEAKKFEQVVTDKIEEIYSMKTLAKNEYQASFYDSGIVKMDFGPDVPQKVKDAAMKWAKRRGLQPVEASLNKTDGAASSISFGAVQPSDHGICVKRMRWTV